MHSSLLGQYTNVLLKAVDWMGNLYCFTYDPATLSRTFYFWFSFDAFNVPVACSNSADETKKSWFFLS